LPRAQRRSSPSTDPFSLETTVSNTTLTVLPTFDAVDLAPQLLALSPAALDGLPYGVVQMDLAGTVTRYNATESRYSGLPAERVLGRHFFRQVAPCSNNRLVAGRFDQAELDETIAYTFALRMKPVPVTLRMLRSGSLAVQFLLVRWS
jgi:photoactive yellow protein